LNPQRRKKYIYTVNIPNLGDIIKQKLFLRNELKEISLIEQIFILWKGKYIIAASAALFTTRIILEQLGVEDFGIKNVVVKMQLKKTKRR